MEEELVGSYSGHGGAEVGASSQSDGKEVGSVLFATGLGGFLSVSHANTNREITKTAFARHRYLAFIRVDPRQMAHGVRLFFSDFSATQSKMHEVVLIVRMLEAQRMT